MCVGAGCAEIDPIVLDDRFKNFPVDSEERVLAGLDVVRLNAAVAIAQEELDISVSRDDEGALARVHADSVGRGLSAD